MSGMMSQVSIPSSARPRFELEGHCSAVHHLGFWAQLVEHRGECNFNRRRNFDRLLDLNSFDRLPSSFGSQQFRWIAEFPWS
jgi:hypothetical protein